MFAEDDIFAFAHEILMLSCEHDVASAAGAVFDGNDNAVLFVAKESLVMARVSLFAWAVEAFAVAFSGLSFFIDQLDARLNLFF